MDLEKQITRAVIDRMPQPPLIFLAPDRAPPLIDFGFVGEPNDNRHLIWIQQVEQTLVDPAQRRLFFLSSFITVVGLILSTLAVSRIPPPLRAISMLCSLT
jgi:hypothetical protein